VVQASPRSTHGPAEEATDWRLPRLRDGLLPVGLSAAANASGHSTPSGASSDGSDGPRPELTHLLALPLRVSAHELLGMVILNIGCLGPAPSAHQWEPFLRALEPQMQLVAPFLAVREASPRTPEPSEPSPPTASPAPTSDEGLSQAPVQSELSPTLPFFRKALQHVEPMLRQLASSSEVLILTGSPGTGRQALAQWFHEQSRQANGPFVTLDLAAVPHETQVVELFGWKYVPQPIDDRSHEGAVGRADKGTLYLANIEHLTAQAQAELLTLLESQRYLRVGEPAARRAQVRLVVSTRIDLQPLVLAGSFREDLYLRLARLPIALANLDERRVEMRDWIQRFMAIRLAELGKSGQVQLSPPAVSLLEAHPWSGGLTQLEKAVRRVLAYHLADPLAGPHIPPELVLPVLQSIRLPAHEALAHRLRSVAQAYVQESLRRHSDGGSLDLTVAEQFGGIVLLEAASMLGSRRAACQLLGLQKVLDGRNDARMFGRYARELQEACEHNGLQAVLTE